MFAMRVHRALSAFACASPAKASIRKARKERPPRSQRQAHFLCELRGFPLRPLRFKALRFSRLLPQLDPLGLGLVSTSIGRRAWCPFNGFVGVYFWLLLPRLAHRSRSRPGCASKFPSLSPPAPHPS